MYQPHKTTGAPSYAVPMCRVPSGLAMSQQKRNEWRAQSGMWVAGAGRRDVHVGFRGRFTLVVPSRVQIQLLATCPFLVFVDGEWIGEGPMRWTDAEPEFQMFEAALSAGSHVLSIHAHYEGVETRLLRQQPGFIACDLVGGDYKAIAWRASILGGYASEVRRINPELGWIDWCETGQTPRGWTDLEFDDSAWPEPLRPSLPMASPRLSPIELQRPIRKNIHAIATGVFTDTFGYDADDPPAQFFLRDLEAHHGPPQGVWRRYDLGRVRLGRPSFRLELPAGAVVEFSYSESLVRGRVSPWITLSGGPSCNLDRFVARGGEQEFLPTTPKGGRFLEVHITADPKQIRFLSENFVERTFHGEPDGAFHCDDKQLTRVWATGVETYRACSEDSVIDNPTRERGEWIGDSLTIGLENAAFTYGDLRLFRKALRQAAQCARSDGLVAGLCPGTVGYLSTYACHWVSAGVRMWQLTGDSALLSELFPQAVKTMKVFSKALTAEGLSGDLGWAFIDWGYVENSGPSDMGLNMIYLGALRSMIQWCHAVGESSSEHQADLVRIEAAIRQYLRSAIFGPKDWSRIGLQRAVLALRANLVSSEQIAACVAFIKSHFLSCFPNDPFAPHLANPGTAQTRLITPFFSHFALPVLWEHGEGEFALKQYRACWGWALSQGLTTWPEVFDLRWSHCHQWSGCPTWQLSRYVLGLAARQDLGSNVFDFAPIPVSLRTASGRVPIPGTRHGVEVTYRQDDGRAYWLIKAKQPIRIRVDGQMVAVTDVFEHSVPYRVL